MSVTPSPIAGFAGQFFDNNGVILSGGKIFTYAAGSTTPQASYTSATGVTPHANPIILDSAGRVPGGEIWLTSGASYKFVLETAASILIGTDDNVAPVIGATSVNFTGFNGQVGYVSDLADDDGSDWIGFDPAGSGATARSAQAKMRDFVSVKDFGAVGDGIANDTAAIQAAVAALPSTGGGLYFPAGTYLVSSAITLNKPGVYYGDGWATNIRTNSATANSFTVSGAEQVQIENMRFTSAVTKTAGWYVDVAASANRFRLSDFAMEGAIGGMRTAAVATCTIERGQILNCVASTAVAIRIDAGFDVSIRDVLSDQAVNIFAGIYVTQAGDVTIEDCNLIHCGQALYVNPGVGQVVASLWANNTFFDTSTRAAYFFAQGGSIVRSLFDQCWFSGSANEGVRLETSGGGVIQGTDFNGCHVYLNAGNGISVIDAGVTNTRVHDCSIAQNTFSGVAVAANVSDVSVQDCRIGNTGGLNGNGASGVALIAGAGTNIQVLNNDLRGNVGANLSNAATGNTIIANNLGANEVWTTYTPTIAAASGTITTLGTVAGLYQKIGKQLFLELSIPITTNGTGATAITATLPSGLLAASDFVIAGRESSVSGDMLQGIILAGSNTFLIYTYNNAYPGANGARLVMTGVIEVQ